MEPRFLIRDGKGKEYIPYSEIRRIEGDDNYIKIIFTNGQQRAGICGSLCWHLENLKDKTAFCRIHKSHAVNIEYVRRVNDDGTVILTDGANLPLGKCYKATLLEMMARHAASVKEPVPSVKPPVPTTDETINGAKA